MTVERVEAVYEGGVFKPLHPLPGLKEQERVRLTIEPTSPSAQEVEKMLAQVFATYEGLTEEQLQQIESARLDQEHFFRSPT